MLHYKKIDFVTDDSGAITVDWVVLCAGIVSLVVLIAGQMTDKAVTLGTATSSYMADKSPDYMADESPE
jgi:hypothetical protein